MTRPSPHDYFLSLAQVVSSRATCARRKVGCVLVNEHNHIMATGYNGPPAGRPHCIDDLCPGAMAESGTKLDACEAIHAEANALLQCPDVQKIVTAYCTTFPCIHCLKMVMNTGCREIIAIESYPGIVENVKLWNNSHAGRVSHLYQPASHDITGCTYKMSDAGVVWKV